MDADRGSCYIMCLDILIVKGVAAVPTKLNTTYISRALADKLAHVPDHPVTTIVAPMGYGKTRAVSWWVEGLPAERPDAVVLRQTIVTDSLSACCGPGRSCAAR